MVIEINKKSFNSIKEASNYFNINPDTISYAMKKNKDFVVRKEDGKMFEIKFEKDEKFENLFLVNGKKFKTLPEAERFFGVSASGLRYALKNNKQYVVNRKQKKVFYVSYVK